MFNPKFSGANKWTASNGLAGGVVITGAQRLFIVVAYNNTAADRWIQFFDAATNPAGGAVPTLPPVRVAANSQGSVDYGAHGRPMAAGIAAVVSTTAATYTAGGNDCFIDVGYRSQ